MFKHLLVPLDGSRLAEAALPFAAYVAQTLGALVTLVHVIEHGAPKKIHGERHLTDPDEACAYLSEVANRAFPANLKVAQHVHTAEVGNVARGIVEHEGELAPDLIVMCTHGSGGVRDWLFGSIAEQVIALGTTPVLLIQPALDGAPPQPACHEILVPLDGNPEHEHGLPIAAALAQACGAALQLIMAVPTLGTLSGQRARTSKLLPRTTAALLDMTQQNAEAYLHERLTPLQTAGLSARGEVARGDPASVIVRTAERIDADLIVLGTHGKAGMDAFWAGSVTPKIADKTRVPLLLVPV